ncbi:MAG: bifunctional 5,10-methylenetetrahydrofolate dehydrogenase/5,10-methenyltetrahydrofolate cyclohydrolase [Clostridiales bacterium]|jgi:methylenetetrahydrofolate dehydrogenase (NADP+)/methenyltetrahydrofolate cyclohydrolase|nr:bifunctional 5,10-methylenetetrahydrofolate dehydrogenase/5,10-methenyltetrahydrofolate cyclohydrolase [Clostridiales bacterium]
MALILKGAPVVSALNKEIADEVVSLKARDVRPTLAIVRVGAREDDIAYERGVINRCSKLGVQTRQLNLPADCTEESLINTLQGLNTDNMVHGVLLFRPLPKHLNDDKIRNTLAVRKDIDGITDLSLAGVFAGTNTGFAPCTAQACMEILDFYDIDLKGKKAVVIGRSLVVGKPAAMMLLGKHATVTMCHTRTYNMSEECKRAEILIVSAGRPKIIDKNYLSPGQVIIDVGINVLEDGVCGDVDFDAVQEGAITPVPGGVGTVTTSVLIKHVVRASQKSVET